MQLLQNLNSIKLLQIAEQFNMYPDQTVTIEEFIEIMTEALRDSAIRDNDNFIQQLVDLFYRCKKTTSKTIKFEQLSVYLIEHEISQSSKGVGERVNTNLKYVKSDLKDSKNHTQFIEKVFFFPQIDKVILYEQNMKNIRIYEAKTMEWIKDIQCVAVILALEYCSSKNALAASLSDRTIVFFDT